MKIRSALALTLVASTSTACMGSFMLTRKLYEFNSRITDNKYINNVIFWALAWILPIYSIALFGDVVILNTIEFWTGKNLLASDVEVERRDDGAVVVRADGRTFVVAPDGDRRAIVTLDGVVVGTAELLDDGSLLLVDDAGAKLALVTPEEREAAAPALQPLAAKLDG
jgi:hypothetical protein